MPLEWHAEEMCADRPTEYAPRTHDHADSRPVMTPEQVRLVQESFAEVAPIADTAADLFYDRLFTIAPDVRPLFPDDLSQQKKKLMQMLGTAVTNLHQVETIIPAVQTLGRRHADYGVTPALRAGRRRALVDTRARSRRGLHAASQGCLDGDLCDHRRRDEEGCSRGADEGRGEGSAQANVRLNWPNPL
jgi:hypothetical protein